MSWLPRRRVQLTPAHAAALEACRNQPAPDLAARVDDLRLVVVDVETTGLRPYQDRLLAIGAVAVSRSRIRLASSFEVTLRQEAPSTEANILVHGIDGTTQTSGLDAPEALVRFLQFVANAPLVAFHADFDRVFLTRALREALGVKPGSAWLDLADLAPALFPEHAGKARTLDEWTTLFGIENSARHEALADAVATAQLLQVVLARAARMKSPRFAELTASAKAHRWLEQSLRSS